MENPRKTMDFPDFPVVLGRSGIHSHPPPAQDACMPRSQERGVRGDGGVEGREVPGVAALARARLRAVA